MKKNTSQLRAIAHLSGPMLVLAGPGSGKTSVIVERTRQLTDTCQVPPSSILVVTFTKAAAKEMKERFLCCTGKQVTQVTFGTFHGVFYGILKHAYGLGAANILSEEQKSQFLKQLIEEYAPQDRDEGDLLEQLSREISLVKGDRISLEHYYAACCDHQVFRSIYQGYVEKCRNKRLYDFDDMLVYCYELLSQRPDILGAWQKKFQYIMVDEFQDINQLQYDIVRLLAKPKNNLFIVGDDDQSIYHFRGARPEIMLNFPKDYPGAQTVVLDINYRCSGEILRCAQEMIGQNKVRFQKNLSAANERGEAVRLEEFPNPREECLFLLKEIQEMVKNQQPLQECAVLFRTNVEAGLLVEMLMEYNIPFYMRDHLPNLYSHWLAKNMLAYLHMAHSAGFRMDRGDFLSVMNRPNRYISREAVYESPVTFESLRIFYEDKDWMCDRLDTMEEDFRRIRDMAPYAAVNYIRHAMGYEEYLQEYARFRRIRPDELTDQLCRIQDSAKGYDTLDAWEKHIRDYTEKLARQYSTGQQKKEGVTISTLHSAKGLEFDRVYILNVNEGWIPYKKAVLDEQLEEERRLFYVGMTRARKRLCLCHACQQFDKPLEPSRFLEEVPV